MTTSQSERHSVVIAGASGVVGARVLQHLLQRFDVNSVTAIGRRLSQQQHPKLVSVIADLNKPASIAGVAPDGASVAFCCLGTTLKQAGSKEAFHAVDYGAVVAFAQAMHDKGVARFVLVTSAGASARSRNFYLKTKGEAEDAIARLGFGHFITLRPSFLDDEGTRKDGRIGEQLALPIARALFCVIGKTHRYAPISVDVVGRAMVRLGFDSEEPKVRVVESDELHSLGRAPLA